MVVVIATPKETENELVCLCNFKSNASLYHLAGDSIIVDVLMAIFGEMV